MNASSGDSLRSGGWLIFLALAGFLLTGSAVTAWAADREGNENFASGAVGDVAAAYFTNLPLITQEGKEIHFFNDLLADRVVVLTGFYVNCTTTSPQENLVLSRLQVLLGDRLGREVGIVSVSVDPKRDTPEKVASYAKVFRPRPGWTFLTGKPENVDWVNYKLGQYHEDPELHRGNYLLGNLKTGLWKKLNPATKAPELLQQIEALLADQRERQ